MKLSYNLNTIIDQWIIPYIDIIRLTLQMQFRPDLQTEHGLFLEHYEHALIGDVLPTLKPPLKLSKENLHWLSNYREWKAYYREFQKPMTKKDLREYITQLVDKDILEKSSIIHCDNKYKKCNYWAEFTEKADSCPKCGYRISIIERIPKRYIINRDTAKKIEKIMTGCMQKYNIIDGSEDYLRLVQRRDKELGVSYSEVLERFKQYEDYLRLKKLKDKECSIQK